MGNKPNKDTLGMLYQGHVAIYETILSSDQNMDTKSGFLIGGGIAFAGLVFQNKIIAQVYSSSVDYVVFFLLFGIFLLAMSIVITFYGIWPKDYNLPSVLYGDHKEYVSMTPANATLQMIVDIEDTILKNEKRLAYKGAMFQAGLILFIIGSVCLLFVKQAL